MKNVVVNVTLPSTVVEYMDEKARKLYISRATVARQLLMEQVEEEKVIEKRKEGFSIRKIVEITGIRYDKVLHIIGRTGIDEDFDEEVDAYMDNIVKEIVKQEKKKNSAK